MPKVKQSLQKVGEARNMGHLNKAVRSDQSWLKKEGTTTIFNAIGVEPPKLFAVRILPHTSLDVRYETTELNVCSVGFWTYFGLIPFCPSICTF